MLEETVKKSDEVLANVDERLNSDEWMEELLNKVTNTKTAEKVQILKKELQMVKKPLPKTSSAEKDEDLSDLMKEFQLEASKSSDRTETKSSKMI